jgi:hypothetical protein
MGSNRKTLRLDSLENDPVLKEWLLSDLLSEGGLDMESADSLLDVNAITLELPPGERWPEGMVRHLKPLPHCHLCAWRGVSVPRLGSTPSTRRSARMPSTRAPAESMAGCAHNAVAFMASGVDGWQRYSHAHCEPAGLQNGVSNL